MDQLDVDPGYTLARMADLLREAARFDDVDDRQVGTEEWLLESLPYFKQSA